MVSATGLVGRFLLGAVPLNSLVLPYVKCTAQLLLNIGNDGQNIRQGWLGKVFIPKGIYPKVFRWSCVVLG